MVDSRFRKSGTPGSFTFELARAITLPSKCAGFVTDIELVHSWYTIDDHNEFLYFREEYKNCLERDKLGTLGFTTGTVAGLVW